MSEVRQNSNKTIENSDKTIEKGEYSLFLLYPSVDWKTIISRSENRRIRSNIGIIGLKVVQDNTIKEYNMEHSPKV